MRPASNAPGVRRPALRAAAAVAAAAGLAVAVAAASPYWAAYQIQRAVQARDADRLARHVDFEALRSHLKATVAAQIGVRTGGRADALAAMMAAVGGRLADAAIDALVTPTGLAAALHGQQVVVGAPLPPRPAGPVGPLDGPFGKPTAPVALDYRSFDEFEIRRTDAARPERATVIVLRRDGWLGWKIVAIDFAGALPIAAPQPAPAAR